MFNFSSDSLSKQVEGRKCLELKRPLLSPEVAPVALLSLASRLFREGRCTGNNKDIYIFFFFFFFLLSQMILLFISASCLLTLHHYSCPGQRATESQWWVGGGRFLLSLRPSGGLPLFRVLRLNLLDVFGTISPVGEDLVPLYCFARLCSVFFSFFFFLNKKRPSNPLFFFSLPPLPLFFFFICLVLADDAPSLAVYVPWLSLFTSLPPSVASW